MTEQARQNPLAMAIEELAASRGIDSLEELVERMCEEDIPTSVEELTSGALPNFGIALDIVLDLNEEETYRVSRGLGALLDQDIASRRRAR